MVWDKGQSRQAFWGFWSHYRRGKGHLVLLAETNIPCHHIMSFPVPLCLCIAQLANSPAACHFLTSYAQQSWLLTSYPIVRSQVLDFGFRSDWNIQNWLLSSEHFCNITFLLKLLLQELKSFTNFLPPSHLAVCGLRVIIYKSKIIAYEPIVTKFL